MSGRQTDLGAKLAFLQSQTAAGAETPPDVDDPEAAGAELRQTLPVRVLALLRHPQAALAGLGWAELSSLINYHDSVRQSADSTLSTVITCSGSGQVSGLSPHY